jgi:hypothetical protein
MEQIRIPNISQYSVKVINGELIITPKDPMNPHIQRYKKEIPRRKPSPKTPDPNKRVEKHEEFEDELWNLDGMISRGKEYTIQDRHEYPSCKCSKSIVYHDTLSDKEWFRHRKEVNRYRRMCANNRVIKPIHESTLVVPDEVESDDEYSMENIIQRMDREELELDLTSQHISFMSGYTDHELRALLRKAYKL